MFLILQLCTNYTPFYKKTLNCIRVFQCNFSLILLIFKLSAAEKSGVAPNYINSICYLFHKYSLIYKYNILLYLLCQDVFHYLIHVLMYTFNICPVIFNKQWHFRNKHANPASKIRERKCFYSHA